MVGSAVDLMLRDKLFVSVTSAPIMPLAENEKNTTVIIKR